MLHTHNKLYTIDPTRTKVYIEDLLQVARHPNVARCYVACCVTCCPKNAQQVEVVECQPLAVRVRAWNERHIYDVDRMSAMSARIDLFAYVEVLS